MTATAVLIHLLGDVALLLWGIHMVNSGITRAFGSDLRWLMGRGLKTRPRAFLTGIGVTAALQSSTATAMMATAFTAGGAVELVPALAVMLGANIGSALIVQLLSFDVTLVFPVLIAVGLFAFQRGGTRRIRDLGRASIGLGLMLLALHLLIATLAPIEASAVLKDLLVAINDDPVFLALLAGALAWVAHSSVAAMLCVMSMAAAGIIDAYAAAAMVLGANLGSALNPVLEGTAGDPVKLRVPAGNLAIRLAGVLVMIGLLRPAVDLLARIESDPARLAANAHLAFNMAVGVVFLPVLPWIARLLRAILPSRIRATDPGVPQHLDQRALTTPAIALSNAEREVLRMVDVLETMLRQSRELLREDDRDKALSVRRMDDVLDRLHDAVHRYLGAIVDDALTPADEQRLADLVAFSINIEHVGDVIDKNLMDLAAKRIRKRIRLSDDALDAIDDLHLQLVDDLHLAVAVLMSHDLPSARRLIAKKERFREHERSAVQRHVASARGRDDTAASALQLDIVRDLKRIEAHIAATAHALLERSGELKPSRLVDG